MRYSSLLFFLLVFTLTTLPQNFTGMKFALDPGHGSPHGATCEPETKRYEAWMNHIVMPYLKQMLQRDGATVFSTRGDFDSLGACITLSEREAVANNNNVDFFHSIHHNAFTGTSNYSLVLFEQLNNTICPNGNPQWPGQADSMAIYMAAELFAGLQTTVGYPRGDYCFLGYNLGVLNNLNMPGVLSEGSFFDFPAEILRLANLDYLKTEAEAQYLSYLKYYKKPLPAHGSLVGLVTNLSSGNPVKGVQVVLTSLGKTYNVDTLGNGFYRFDSLAPGTYPISVYSNLDTTTTTVTVVAGKINKKNLLSGSADAPPPVKLLSVTGSDGALNLKWEQPSGLVDSILIYLSENGAPPTGAPFKSLAGNVTTHTLTGLTSGETYYVALKAKNLLEKVHIFQKFMVLLLQQLEIRFFWLTDLTDMAAQGAGNSLTTTSLHIMVKPWHNFPEDFRLLPTLQLHRLHRLNLLNICFGCWEMNLQLMKLFPPPNKLLLKNTFRMVESCL
ncbi:MAG: N-acetylmuramoyl-L-alanine amidase [Ignavibacteriales bacterium]|nr:N-acetylmuramoyl-L-alanine amidase [Ignavibacteriales bacterium]